MSFWRRLLDRFGSPDARRPQRLDYLNEALALERQGDYVAALTSYRLGLRDNPRDPRILQNMAIAFTKTGQPDEAIRHYRRALDLDPTLTGAHYGVAFLLAKKGDSAEAAQHLRAFLDLRDRLAFAAVGVRAVPELVPLSSAVITVAAVHIHLRPVLAVRDLGTEGGNGEGDRARRDDRPVLLKEESFRARRRLRWLPAFALARAERVSVPAVCRPCILADAGGLPVRRMAGGIVAEGDRPFPAHRRTAPAARARGGARRARGGGSRGGGG